MELNDALKNIHFGCVLDSHLWKISDEYTALAALKYCFGEEYKHMRKAETPDLQDVENSVAIEVTSSVTSDEARITGEFTRLQQVPTEKDKVKCRKKIEAGGANLEDDGFLLFRPEDPIDERTAMVNAFTKKRDKVSAYLEKGFKRIGLLIYHEKPIFSETETEFQEWFAAEQKDKTDKYDFVYILHTDGLLFYDFTTGEKDRIKISCEDRRALGNLGRMAAEGKVKDDDPIWL